MPFAPPTPAVQSAPKAGIEPAHHSQRVNTVCGSQDLKGIRAEVGRWAHEGYPILRPIDGVLAGLAALAFAFLLSAGS